MAWTKKQKMAIEAEIALFRDNAIHPSKESYTDLMLSEWPLCSLYAEMNTCEGCHVFIKTGKAHCIDTPLMNAITTWDEYTDGEMNVGGLSHAITEAADWLENEVLNHDHD